MDSAYIEQAVQSAFNITTEEEALRAILTTAKEYASGIYDWFHDQPDKYNFLADPEDEFPRQRYTGWEQHPDSEGKMKPLFGSVFIVNCRMESHINGQFKWLEVTRRFPINKPEPNRKFY